MPEYIDERQTARKSGFSSLEIIALVWILLALASLLILPGRLDTSLPVFIIIWLVVPLIVLLTRRSAPCIGIQRLSWPVLARFTALNLSLLGLVMLLFEPWSHTYRTLLQMVFSEARPDLTFVWLSRFPGVVGLMGMTFYSGLVTLFGEELFFRGWLLQLLLKKMRPMWAIALQAFFFTIPQSLAAFFLPPLQGVLYVVIYAWLAIGVVGGWAAWRTGTIWPSLISATIMNLILCVVWIVR